MAQAKAAERLVGIEGIELPWQRLEAELRFVADDPLLTYQSGQAAAKAMKVLTFIEGREDEPIDFKGPPTPIWQNEGLELAERLIWLTVMLPSDAEDLMRTLHGWRIDQREWREGSPRTRWLVREASAVLDSADPIAAARTWLESPCGALPA